MTEEELTASAVAAAGRLNRFALQLCGDRSLAEDLVQEGFLHALRSRRHLRDPGPVVPWLFGMVRRTFPRPAPSRRRPRAMVCAEQVHGFTVCRRTLDGLEYLFVSDLPARRAGNVMTAALGPEQVQ